MGRKKKQEEHVNHERWLVSYADFITLLFAFFVVMYAISSVNEGKYRVVSETLKETFDAPVSSLQPIQLGTVAKFLSNYPEQNPSLPVNQTVNNPQADNDFSLEIPVDLMSQEARREFKGLIDEEVIALKETSEWLEIEIQSSLLFNSASAELSLDGESIIIEIAKTLKRFNASVSVEGYTDNIPIKNDVFPSNWELSVGRSSSIVRLLIEGGVNPSRLSAIGYGENFPVGDNETVEGRRANRRVIIVVERENQRKAFLKQKEFAYLEEVEESIDEEFLDESEEYVSEEETAESDKNEQLDEIVPDELEQTIEQEERLVPEQAIETTDVPVNQTVPLAEPQKQDIADKAPAKSEEESLDPKNFDKEKFHRAIQGVRTQGGGLKFDASSIQVVPNEEKSNTNDNRNADGEEVPAETVTEEKP